MRDVNRKSLSEAIDTGTPSGRLFFNFMASLAEMERDLIAEYTRAGPDVARKFSHKHSCKPKMIDSKIESAKNLLASGAPPKNLGASVPTLDCCVPASVHAWRTVFSVSEAAPT